MSVPYQRWNTGDTRTRWVTVSAGEHSFGNGVVVFPFRVRLKVTETYKWGAWQSGVWDPDTAVPCPYWWQRAWRWVARRPRLPRAHTVKR